MATRGKLFVVGIGPGALEHMTLKALDVLRQAEVIVAYTGYLKILNKLGQQGGRRCLQQGWAKRLSESN